MPLKSIAIFSWLLLYILLAILPLCLALGIERPAPRALTVEIGAMLGLLGLGVLAMQLVISGRHRWFASGVGQDNLLQFHRRTGIFAWLLVLAHPITLFIADSNFLAYLDPREDWIRASSLSFVLLATTILIVTSLWRVSMGLQYESWRLLHGVLSLLVVAGGLTHALLVDHHSAGLITKLALSAVIAFPLALLVESRLLRPWRLKRQPWKVVQVESRRAQATSIMLEAQGHSGLNFQPGQYAWVSFGDSPWTLQQHPFSMASTANDHVQLEFIIKQAGDFTEALADIPVGTSAWLEGPYGVFSMDPSAGRRAVFIVGGIGITPVLSMLRTCKALGCTQEMWLIYANKEQTDIILREAIDELAEALPLTLVHVLSDPDDDWEGETGYVETDLLERTLPPDNDDIDYFVCGPTPMMDTVEPALRDRGTSLHRLYSERFDLV